MISDLALKNINCNFLSSRLCRQSRRARASSTHGESALGVMDLQELSHKICEIARSIHESFTPQNFPAVRYLLYMCSNCLCTYVRIHSMYIYIYICTIYCVCVQ